MKKLNLIAVLASLSLSVSALADDSHKAEDKAPAAAADGQKAPAAQDTKKAAKKAKKETKKEEAAKTEGAKEGETK